MRTGVAFLLFCVALPDAHAAREKPAYSGVRLGQTQAEVRYMLGYPPNVMGSIYLFDPAGKTLKMRGWEAAIRDYRTKLGRYG